jgi:alpha-mannosidase
MIKGDWSPYWEDGAGSSALETAMNRASSDRLSQAEALWAMKDPANYPVADFEEAWKKVLLYSEHTWGAWCSVSDPENKMTKEQWNIKQSYALDADKQSRILLETILKKTDKNPSATTIDIYNTNSWPRSEVMLIPASLSKPGNRVTDSNNKGVPSQRLSTGELAILVKSLPPYSCRQYQISPGKAFGEDQLKIGGTTISNGIVSVGIDTKTGAISELKSVDQKDINLVNSASGYGLNDYAFLDSAKMNDIGRTSKVQIKIKEKGPLVASFIVESDAPSCNKLIREVRLLAGQPQVEITNILDKKRAEISRKPGDWTFAQKGGKESVNFAFPFKVENGIVRMDVQYGVFQAEKDQIPSACKNWLTAGRWADVSNGQTGVALITLDAPLFEVGGITANMLGSQTNPEVWRKHIEPTQTLFSWAINNHWGTNYRAYQEGLIIFRYALWPHQQFSASENSKYAIELSQPLLVKKGSENGPDVSGVYPDNPRVIVTAYKPCDNGLGKMITLFNSSTTTANTKLISGKIFMHHIWSSDSSEE